MAFEVGELGIDMYSRSSISLTREIEGDLLGLSVSNPSMAQVSAKSARTRSTVAGCDE